MRTQIASFLYSCLGIVMTSRLDATAMNNLFVANWYYPGAITSITPGGSQSTFYSGGLGEPQALAFDGSGNLFVADSYVGSVYEITPGGSRSTFATGLNGLSGLAFNQAGNLFASVTSGNIYEYTPGGSRSTFASGIVNPYKFGFDSAGNLFVTFSGTGLGNGGIMKITPGGVQSIFATGLYNPQYVAFDSAGNLYLSDDGSGTVYEYTSGGSRSTFATGLGEATGLAFQGLSLPVPEPSTLGLLAVGPIAFLVRLKKRNHCQ